MKINHETNNPELLHLRVVDLLQIKQYVINWDTLQFVILHQMVQEPTAPIVGCRWLAPFTPQLSISCLLCCVCRYMIMKNIERNFVLTILKEAMDKNVLLVFRCFSFCYRRMARFNMPDKGNVWATHHATRPQRASYGPIVIHWERALESGTLTLADMNLMEKEGCKKSFVKA